MTAQDLKARCERAQRMLGRMHGVFQTVSRLGACDLTPEMSLAILKEIAGRENSYDATCADDVLRLAANCLDPLVDDLRAVSSAGQIGQAVWNGVRFGAYEALDKATPASCEETGVCEAIR